jgi:amino acid transporter
VNVFYIAFTGADGQVNIAGVISMAALLLVNCFFAGFSSLTVTSRIGFAMARDGAFPYSDKLSYVHPKTKSPVAMIFLVFILDALFCSLPLISETAFDAITSITTIGYEISYMIPILLRITVARNTFKPSSFHLGKFSMPCGILSVIYLIFTSVIFLFPTAFSSDGTLTFAVFNYTPVVVAAVLLIALIYWWLPRPYGARYFFVGPKRKEEEGELSTENSPDKHNDNGVPVHYSVKKSTFIGRDSEINSKNNKSLYKSLHTSVNE